MDRKMSTVFVTGGTGFIGSNLIRLLLKSGFAVRALVRPQSCRYNLTGLDIDMVEGDLNSPELGQHLKGCRYLFHVAAHYSLWQSERNLLYQSNVLGTRRVLDAARQAGIKRTVYTSSVAAIGVGPNGAVLNERDQSSLEELVGHYKKSKFLAEQEVYRAIQLHQDIVIVNPTTPIGPWDVKPTPTGDIILRFLRRQMPAYVNTGLNFIDVRDVAKGHLLALHFGKTGERYILGHQNLTLKELLDLLAKVTGLASPRYSLLIWLPLCMSWLDEYILPQFGKTPSIPFDGVRMSGQMMYYSTTKAVTELGLPQSSIEGALRSAVDWFVSRGYVKLSEKNQQGEFIKT